MILRSKIILEIFVVGCCLVELHVCLFNCKSFSRGWNYLENNRVSQPSDTVLKVTSSNDFQNNFEHEFSIFALTLTFHKLFLSNINFP